MKLFILFFINTVISCGMPSERAIFSDTVDAFKFLSKYHHELHVMIGEEEGDFKESYNLFYKYISSSSNQKLLPVKNGFFRIKNLSKGSKDVKDFDALVDYYQSGLSLEIEAVLKGYGYEGAFDSNTALSTYDSLTKK